TGAGGSRQGRGRSEQTRAIMSAGFTSGELFGIGNPAGHSILSDFVGGRNTDSRSWILLTRKSDKSG
ncbi:unnamed protein product, partial [Ectocarpus sp. 12 AP-2014]